MYASSRSSVRRAAAAAAATVMSAARDGSQSCCHGPPYAVVRVVTAAHGLAAEALLSRVRTAPDRGVAALAAGGAPQGSRPRLQLADAAPLMSVSRCSRRPTVSSCCAVLRLRAQERVAHPAGAHVPTGTFGLTSNARRLLAQRCGSG